MTLILLVGSMLQRVDATVFEYSEAKFCAFTTLLSIVLTCVLFETDDRCKATSMLFSSGTRMQVTTVLALIVAMLSLV